MSSYIDLERVRGLEEVMGAGAEAIVASMLKSMTGAIEQIESALAVGGLERATQAAHACRNDAMMLGARPLLEVLTELEAAGREHDGARAAAALERLQAVWPPTRDELTGTSNPP